MRLAKYAERGFEVCKLIQYCYILKCLYSLFSYYLYFFVYKKQIDIPSLERSRINPAIYEKSCEKLHGLARLLVLERLNTSDNRVEYVKKIRERKLLKPTTQKPLYLYSWERKNLKNEDDKFEDSDYETATLPYGPKFNANKIMKLTYSKVFAKKIFFFCLSKKYI